MRFADVLAWRWTPTFALVGGALVFVLLAVAIVPDQFGEAADLRSAKASASGQAVAGPGASSGVRSPPFAPAAAPVAPAAVSTEGPSRERKPRERKPYVPHGPKVYENNVVDRIFNRGGTSRAAPEEGEGPSEPPPSAPAPTVVVPPEASEPPAGDAPGAPPVPL